MPTKKRYPVESSWIAEDAVESIQREGYHAEVQERGRGRDCEFLVAADAPSHLVLDAIDDAKEAFEEDAPSAREKRLKRGTKKRMREALKLQRMMREWIEEVGGTIIEDREESLRGEVETQYGPLRITIPGVIPTFEDSATITIFTRFEDVSAPPRSLQANPYSGKWNHHFSDDAVASDAMEQWLRVVQLVRPE